MSETTLSKSAQKNGAVENRSVRPSYRVESDKEAHKLFVAMPGVNKSGIEIALDGDALTVAGHRADPIPEGWRPVFSELGSHDYRLALRLNVDVDEDKIRANIEDGLLTLTLPVREAAKPRQISIT